MKKLVLILLFFLSLSSIVSAGVILSNKPHLVGNKFGVGVTKKVSTTTPAISLFTYQNTGGVSYLDTGGITYKDY